MDQPNVIDNSFVLECPNCKRLGKKQVLGKVNADGSFTILRFHHGTTVIKSENYQIACGCGYVFDIANGTVVIK